MRVVLCQVYFDVLGLPFLKGPNPILSYILCYLFISFIIIHNSYTYNSVLNKNETWLIYNHLGLIPTHTVAFY